MFTLNLQHLPEKEVAFSTQRNTQFLQMSDIDYLEFFIVIKMI